MSASNLARQVQVREHITVHPTDTLSVHAKNIVGR